MILHTINKSPLAQSAFKDCFATLQTADCVLLIEDGVYAAILNSNSAQCISSCDPSIKFYVLEDDVLARGIQGNLCENVTLIDYAGFVDLAVKASSVSSWY